VPTHLTSLLYLFPNIPPINPATINTIPMYGAIYY
jgi:hypothetical protein